MNKKAQETDVPKAIAGLLLSVVVLLVLFGIIYSLISYFTDAKDEHKEAIAMFDNIAEEVKLLAEGLGSGVHEASITIPVDFRDKKYFVSAEDVSSDSERLCLYMLTGSGKEALKCHSLGVDYTQASFTGQPFDASDAAGGDQNRKIFNLKITAKKDEKSGVVLVSLVPMR